MATITSLGFNIGSNWDGSGVRAARNDLAALSGELEALSRKRIVLDVDLDAAAAQAELAAMTEDREVLLDVQADTGQAAAEIAAVAHDRNVRVNVDTDQALVNVRRLGGAFNGAGEHAKNFGLLSQKGLTFTQLAVLGAVAAFNLLGPAVTAVGAIISTALPAAMIGASFVILRENEAIRQSWGHLKDDAGVIFREAAQSMVDPLVNAADIIHDRLWELKPLLTETFEATGPLVDELARGIMRMAEGALPGMRDALRDMEPMMKGLEDGMARFGERIGNMFRGMMADAEGFGDMWRVLGDRMGEFFEIWGVRSGQFAKEGAVMFDGVMGGINRLIDGILFGLGGAMQHMAGPLSEFWYVFGHTFGDAFAQVLPALGEVTAALAPILTDVLKIVIPPIAELATIILQNLAPVIRDLHPLILVAAQNFAELVRAIQPHIPQIMELATKLVEQLTPAFIHLLEEVTDFVLTADGQLNPAFQKMIDLSIEMLPAVSDLVNGIADLVDACDPAAGVIIGVTVAVWGLNAALAINPFTGIAIAITAVTLALIKLEQETGVFSSHFHEMGREWATFTTWLGDHFEEMGREWGVFTLAIGDHFREMGRELTVLEANLDKFFNGIGNGLKTWAQDIGSEFTTLEATLDNFFNGIGQGFKNFGADISSEWDTMWTTIDQKWDTFTADVRAVWDPFWQDLKLSVSGMTTATGIVWGSLWTEVKERWNTYTAEMGQEWSTFWTTVVKDPVKGWWGEISSEWNTMWTTVDTKWSEYTAELGQEWSTFWNGTIKDPVKGWWGEINREWDTMWTTIDTKWESYKAELGQEWNTFWTTVIKEPAKTHWNEIQSEWNTALGWLGQHWRTHKEEIGREWNTFWTGIKQFGIDTWNDIKEEFATWGNDLKEEIDTIVRKVGEAWSKIVPAFNDPLGFIKGAWNAVAPIFGLEPIGKADGGAVGGGGTSAGSFATGGPVPGIGGPTEDNIPAWLSVGEHVWTASEVKAAGGHRSVEQLRQRVVEGQGYAAGGPVEWMWGKVRSIEPSMQLTSSYRDTNDYHGQGKAIDVSNGSDSTPEMRNVATVVANKWGRDTLELIHSPFNMNIKDGRNVGDGMGLYGAGTMAQHRNHVHWAVARALDGEAGLPIGDGGGYSGPSAAQIAAHREAVAEIEAIINRTNENTATRMFAYGKVRDGAGKGYGDFNKVKQMKSPFGVYAPAGDVHGGGILGSGSGAINQLNAALAAAKAAIGGVIPEGERRAIIEHAMRITNTPPPDTVEDWLRGMNTLISRESGWNPGAVNTTDSNAAAGNASRGLAQVVPTTFATYKVPGYDNIDAPVDNVAASINYIKSKYGSIFNVQQANANMPPKGYAEGTMNAPAGWAIVGERGPEAVRFRGGEKVHSFDEIIEKIKQEASGNAQQIADQVAREVAAAIDRLSSEAHTHNSELANKLASEMRSMAERLADLVGIEIQVPVSIGDGINDGQEVVSLIQQQVVPKLEMAVRQGIGRRNA
ncbi:transglycosylase SLT domain-containing protein [Rhodococcus sp. 11-3]|uniref:transglycosylase SLT domain-containing protein n=1 Tax=Rhodococcus sp. 11-3 TaxID=2854796 RepID=UPI00203AD3FE|nr:transglycosylase SLT domain-containing protein [Rhodococcus sp. 11-3]USC17042.1 transglycosylase SLT domain-containing protein [Rhodococcus sp. 11-3]